MKTRDIKIGNAIVNVKVVSPKSKRKVLTASEIEMDKRAENAIKAAIKKAKICKKPVARYDVSSNEIAFE